MRSNLQPSSISIIRSKREICRNFAIAVSFFGSCVLLIKMGYGLLGHEWLAWVGWMFLTLSFLSLIGLTYVVIVMIRLLKAIDKPFISIFEEGLVIHELDSEPIKWDAISSAILIKRQVGDGGAITELVLRIKPFLREVTITVDALKLEPERILAAINSAREGGQPWAKNTIYEANSVSLGNRIVYLLSSVFLLSYSSWSVWQDDLYIVGKRGSVHLQGAAALALGIAMICIATTILIEVIDHYDKRNNEHWYDRFSCYISISGGLLVSTTMLYL